MERFTPSRYYLTTHMGPVTLCARNCIARDFRFTRVVRTSSLKPNVFPHLTDPDLRKPAHFEAFLAIGLLRG